MDRFFSRGRLGFLSLLLALLLGLYLVTLYKLQIVDGAAYYESSTNSIPTTKTVKAARGDILDRYGRLLVSNRACSNIVLDTDELFEQEDPNAIILQLIEICESYGEKHTDTMPVTMEAPFEYVSNMTSLQSYFLKGYLAAKELPEDTSAVELLAYCRSRYDIDPSYDGRQSRLIAGVRYELNGRYDVPTAPYIFAEDVGIDLITKLLESNLPGFDVEVSYIREYKTDYASHILGYINDMSPEQYEVYRKEGYDMDAQVGQDGVERAFESYLHGSDGEARITKTATGVVTSTVYTEEPEPGNHVYLTIDIGLQEAAEQALSSYIAEENAQREVDNAEFEALGQTEDIKQLITGGGIAVVKVDSGEPLAVASYPTFDLSSVMEDWNELLEDENNPLFNRALNGIYAPGSTFKPAVAIAALNEGIITPTTTITDELEFTKYADQGYAPRCWIYGKGTHGTINVTGAVEVSCNYFFYTVGDFLGIDRINKYTREFGLGEPTGIELVESEGTLTTEEFKMNLLGEPLYLGDTLQAAIGQGWHQFTPLQLANYTATLANGGTRYSCSMLKSVRNYGYSESLYDRQREVLSTVDAKPEYFKAVTDGMYAVANSVMGTAYETFGNYPVKVAAKTGTAQMGEKVTNNGVFVCYAPAENPEIAICVAVEKGGAGSAIAEIARNVLDYYFSFKNSTVTLETEMSLLK
ncbi:MAG: penicillin-binding transpeptidase domain-containing protein [Candidatus Heteroscillospira sp.]|jgi:penicillin-binding protein 2